MSRTSKSVAKAAVTLLFSLGLVVSAPPRSEAQLIPFVEDLGPSLNRADFKLADAAARKLMDPTPAALGTAVAWDNPASGNSGLLTMGRAYQKGGYDCRVVTWHDVFRSGTKRTFILDTCHVSGTWKLM